MARSTSSKPAILCCLLGLSWPAGAAFAQTAPDRSPSPNPPTSDTTQSADPRQDPRSTGAAARPGETLSERLDRTGGVIRPPANLTPDNTIRPRDTGTTPVIPPPGSPGGNPNIEPK